MYAAACIAIALEIGTAAVLIRSTDRVIVAVDSKTTRSDDESFSKESCKILLGETSIFVSAGLRREGALGFDIVKTAREALSASLDVGEQMSLFETCFALELTRVLNIALKKEPTWFDTHFLKQGNLASQAAFVGLDGRAFVSAFRPILRDGLVVLVVDQVDFPARTAVFLGEDEAMIAVATELGAFLIERPEASARALIGAAIQSSPARVGGPIRILKIKSGTAEWLEGNCEQR